MPPAAKKTVPKEDPPAPQRTETPAQQLGDDERAELERLRQAERDRNAEQTNLSDDDRAELERHREMQRLREETAVSAQEREELLQLRQEKADRAAADQRRDERADGKGPTIDLSDDDQDARAERYADWPERGGSDLPQPWDHKAMGLQNAVRDLMDDQPAGAPNTVSPIVITHGRPLLTYGSSDPSVQELGRILGALGFENSVSRGANPFGAVDDTVMNAVHAFRDAYDVQEDPSGFGGNTPAGRERAEAHIGPWTWEAILRAGEQATTRA